MRTHEHFVFQPMVSERVRRPIVFAADEAYAMPLAITLRSIVEANQSSWPMEFHVLSDDSSERTRGRVINSLPKGAASICWVPARLNLFREFSTLPYVSRVTYARLLIPWVLPVTVSRVLYLDCDLLVLDDLEPVWETDLEGAVLGAVVDGMADCKLCDPRFEGVPQVRDYFNAGVMLIDVQRWREERISERALEYLTRNPRSPYSDQDALNVACDNQWKRLDSHWNFQNHYNRRVSAIRPKDRPGIVHFVTNSKPWISSVRSVNAGLYDDFRNRTRFARSPVNRLVDSIVGFSAGVRNVWRRRILRSGASGAA